MMHLKILTPSRELADVAIEKIALPGKVSPFMVLQNHAPLISSLTAGEVRYTTCEGEQRCLPIRGGFVHVCNNEIELCVEPA